LSLENGYWWVTFNAGLRLDSCWLESSLLVGMRTNLYCSQFHPQYLMNKKA